MKIDFEVHGVLSHGHRIWHEKSEYSKRFYTNLESRGNSNSSFFIEINNINSTLKTFYTYIVNNINASSGRAGSYFGITITTDIIHTDIKLIYAILDSLFNKLVVNKILEPLENNKFKYICNDDFSEVESTLLQMEEIFNKAIRTTSANSDIKNIPPTYKKIPQQRIIDTASLSNNTITDIINGITIIAIPNISASRISELEKKITTANSQLSDFSQKLTSSENKCKSLEQQVVSLTAKVKNTPPAQTSISQLEKLVDDTKKIIYEFNQFVSSNTPHKKQPPREGPQGPIQGSGQRGRRQSQSILPNFIPKGIGCVFAIIMLITCVFSGMSAYNAIADSKSTQPIVEKDSIVPKKESILAINPTLKIDIPNESLDKGKLIKGSLSKVTLEGSTSKDSLDWAIISSEEKTISRSNTLIAPAKGCVTILCIKNNKIIQLRSISVADK